MPKPNTPKHKKLLKKKQEKKETSQISEKLNTEVAKYIYQMISHGHSTSKIKKTLLGSGWPESEINKRISNSRTLINKKMEENKKLAVEAKTPKVSIFKNFLKKMKGKKKFQI